MTGDPFPVLRMKELIAINSLQPLFKSNAQVIEQDAVGIKTFATGSEYSGARTFATGSEYSNKLRNDVDYLPELHFTSAPFLLCSFTLSDVDHSAHKFNEMAGRAQNRMT